MSNSSTVSGGSSPGTALWEFDHGHGAMPWAGATAPDVTALQQIRGIPSRRLRGAPQRCLRLLGVRTLEAVVLTCFHNDRVGEEAQ